MSALGLGFIAPILQFGGESNFGLSSKHGPLTYLAFELWISRSSKKKKNLHENQ